MKSRCLMFKQTFLIIKFLVNLYTIEAFNILRSNYFGYDSGKVYLLMISKKCLLSNLTKLLLSCYLVEEYTSYIIHWNILVC